MVLEDASGRISLIGDRLKREQVVTGIIMAALGMETSDGDFEVVDVCFAGIAPHAPVADAARDDAEDMDVDGVVLSSSMAGSHTDAPSFNRTCRWSFGKDGKYDIGFLDSIAFRT